MLTRALLVLILPLTLAAAPALAQDRTPDERQTIGELAYALGESHALRQVCSGPNDQYWRDRMVRLTEVEAADPAFDAVIRERFNTGFAAGQAQAQRCNAASLRAEAGAAARGQTLAQKLSTVMRKLDPPASSEPADPLN